MFSGGIGKVAKTCFLNVFFNVLGSKMDSRPNRPQPLEPPAPFLMTKPFKNCQKKLQKIFFWESPESFCRVFVKVFGRFLAGFGKVAKKGFLGVFVEILIN